MQRKINLKLFDFDNCLGLVNRNNNNLDLNDPLIYRNWLLNYNKNFFDQLVAEIKAAKYNLIIIACGSHRQDYNTDEINKFRYSNGSFAWMLPIVQNYLAEQLKGSVDVVLDPFLLADIYGKDKKAGDSYKAILKTLMGDTTQVHAKFMVSKSKTSLIYAFAHRVATLNPDAKIDMDFYDDIRDILSNIHSDIAPDRKLSQDNWHFLPDKINLLRLYEYETGNNCEQIAAGIKGQGKTDECYDWSLRLMSARSYFFNSINAGLDVGLETAEALTAYHSEYHYDYRGREWKMGFPNAAFTQGQFISLRDKIAQQLKRDPELTHKNNYTTMEKLAQEGLIPEALTNALSANKITNSLPFFAGSKPVQEKSDEPDELIEEVITIKIDGSG